MSFGQEENPNLSSLLSSAQGLKDDALMSRAFVYRFREGKEKELHSVNLSEILSGKEKFDLEANDRVQVFSKSILERKDFVEIRGEINSPDDTGGRFPFFE